MRAARLNRRRPASGRLQASSGDGGWPRAVKAGPACQVLKRPLPVDVTFAEAPGELVTREGLVRHAAGAALLTGPLGERWPIERERFLASYVPLPPTRPGEPGQYRKIPRLVSARQLLAPCRIRLRGGRGELLGQTGDWLVRYAPGDFGIVGAAIFTLTYEVFGDA